MDHAIIGHSEARGSGAEACAVPSQHTKNSLDEVSFVLRIQNLVLQILQQLARTAEHDRSLSKEWKSVYKQTSQEAAELTKKIGGAAPWIAVAGLAISLCSGLTADPGRQKLIQSLAEQGPNSVGQFYTSRLQCKQAEEQAKSSLTLQEIQSKSQKASAEASSKGEILQLLHAALESLRKASSP